MCTCGRRRARPPSPPGASRWTGGGPAPGPTPTTRCRATCCARPRPTSARCGTRTPAGRSSAAPPLFVMLLGECLRWGAHPDRVRALLPAADAGLTWIERYGDRDGDGFVEYLRATDRGLANQGWKDSFDAISDRAGRLAEAPIALCEVQGYVYAAYLARAYLAETLEGDAAGAARWRTAAARLRAAFQERFWLPDLGWYALGLDAGK